MNQFDNSNEAIDVAYRTASDDELFGSAAQTAAATEEARLQVINDPDRCFCRNCGSPIYKNASVCVHCNYVMNAAALRQGQQIVRARREKYEKGHRIRSFITALTGIQLESAQQQQNWAVRRQDYHYQTTGAVYCVNCGCEVDPGASVCVRCNYVLDPAAVQRAQIMVSDRNAKLTKRDLIKSLLIPGYGKKIYQQYAVRRPQVANPCRLAGCINKGLICAASFVLGYLIFFA